MAAMIRHRKNVFIVISAVSKGCGSTDVFSYLKYISLLYLLFSKDLVQQMCLVIRNTGIDCIVMSIIFK